VVKLLEITTGGGSRQPTHCFPPQRVSVVCFREHTMAGRADISNSIVLSVTVPTFDLYTGEST
jgi:hypothetical protein